MRAARGGARGSARETGRVLSLSFAVFVVCAGATDTRSAEFAALERRVAAEEARFGRFMRALPKRGAPTDAPSIDPKRVRPYYESAVVHRDFVLEEGARAILLLNLAFRMEESRLHTVTFENERHAGRYSPPFGSLQDLSIAELAAALMAADPSHRGAEFDRILRDAAGLHAVTARHDLDGVLRVASRPLRMIPGPTEKPPVDWTARFGIPRPRAGTAEWTGRQLALLAEALAMVGAEDLAAIEGLSFRREVVPPA